MSVAAVATVCFALPLTAVRRILCSGQDHEDQVLRQVQGPVLSVSFAARKVTHTAPRSAHPQAGRRYLYTLVVTDAEKADKLKQSLPPGPRPLASPELHRPDCADRCAHPTAGLTVQDLSEKK